MITLETTYSKKLGLPGFSSHQFSVTLRTEVVDLSQVQNESARLYKLLQDGVDTSIKETGYLPASNGNANSSNGHPITNGHNGGHLNRNPGPHARAGDNGTDQWSCSPKQRDLILKITDEHSLNKSDVEALAQDRFGKGVRELNKLEASGLIEELFERTGQPSGNRRNRFQPRNQTAIAR